MLFFHPFIGFTTDTLKHLIISTLAPSIWQGRVVPIFATTLYSGCPVLTVVLSIIQGTN